VRMRTGPGPRERLLEAAQRLTYLQGANVGVDALLTEADVARRSLYEHFGGKDGLIAEVLRRSASEDLGRYRTVMDAAGGDPSQRLLAIFDDLEAVVRQPDFRGCRYLAADLALSDPGHPAHAITADYRRQVHRLLADELIRLGHPRPDQAADELHLLIEGVLTTGATRPETNPARAARGLAWRVLEQ
jgi:AcrR family transcriptional regulator